MGHHTKRRTSMKRRGEKGGVMIYIFLAVSMFAALSYTVANMMRGGGNTTSISQEQAGIFASEIINYARGLRAGVQDMRISFGCADNEISFENDEMIAYTFATRDQCKLFDRAGGTKVFLEPTERAMDGGMSSIGNFPFWRFDASHCVVNVGTHSGTCEDSEIDLIASLVGVKREVCIELNEKLGIDNPSGEPPVERSSHTPAFAGVYGPASNIVFGDDGPSLVGKLNGCYQDPDGFTANAYIYYQVVLAR